MAIKDESCPLLTRSTPVFLERWCDDVSLKAEALDDLREDERGSQFQNKKEEEALRSIKDGIFENKKPTPLGKGEEIAANPRAFFTSFMP